MDIFVKHEPCPECRKQGRDRSGNNLGVWEDHKYCFACGYHEYDNSLNLNRIKDNKKSQDVYTLNLPADCSFSLPEKALIWLEKYGLSDDEMGTFQWSEKFQRLIYPVYDVYGNLLLYQGRGFHEGGEKHPKYYTVGDTSKVFHCLGAYEPRIILVEDVVSAIKIGRQAHSMPLWGSQIGSERIRMLSGQFFKLWIWLDKDKAEYSLKSRLMASPYFDETRCIITDKDPKDYSDMEIKEILNR